MCQGIGLDDIYVDAFGHGGMNVTGFRLVDRTNSTVRLFLNDWSKMDKALYKGAGEQKITVSYQTNTEV